MNEEFELTPEEIQEIRTLREQGLSYRNIAKKTGRSLGIVAKYCKGIRPLVLEEKDLLDYLEPKLNKLEQQVDRLKENQKDLIELVFANILGISRALNLNVDEERAELIKEKLLSSLED
jgi:transcriptional regulator with XRE-family HTH domain